MPFLDDPVSSTPVLLMSARERIRLSRLYCAELRTAYDNALDAIIRSQQTIRHNELSMTPELALLIDTRALCQTPEQTVSLYTTADNGLAKGRPDSTCP